MAESMIALPPVAVMVAAPPVTPAWRELACAVIEKAILDLQLPARPDHRRPGDGTEVQRDAARFFADPDSDLTFWATASGLPRSLIVERVQRLHGERLTYWLHYGEDTGRV